MQKKVISLYVSPTSLLVSLSHRLTNDSPPIMMTGKGGTGGGDSGWQERKTATEETKTKKER